MNDGATAQATVANPGTGAVASGDPPEPILPNWNGPCLHRVVPTLLGHLALPGAAPLPPWFPAPVAEARQIVLLVLDGLGAEQLHERAGLAPTLPAAVGTAMTSVAPSTTACALTTLVTGRVPAEHGVVGYRVALDGEVMNVLQWSVGMVPTPGFGCRRTYSSRSSRSPVPRAGCPSSRATTTARPASLPRTWGTWTSTAGTRRPGW